MTVVSMTGFARRQGQDARHGWTWELKSVNHRAFDLRCRLPQGLDALEPELRRRTAARIRRGSVTASLALAHGAGGAGVALNRALLDQVLAIAARLGEEITLRPAAIDGLLAIPGMIQPVEEDAEAVAARDAAILASFEDGLEALCGARAAEGARLEPVLARLLDDMAALADQARAAAAAQPAAIRARLEAQIGELLAVAPALPEERLAQEVALLAVKGDVREEIDRLCAHVGAAQGLLGDAEPVGRQLDFLCQELNREANTLCSKAAEVALTRIGLALKAVIDQLREQVQNIE